LEPAMMELWDDYYWPWCIYVAASWLISCWEGYIPLVELGSVG